MDDVIASKEVGPQNNSGLPALDAEYKEVAIFLTGNLTRVIIGRVYLSQVQL